MAAGPVIVARPGKPKIVVLGFHPVLTGMRYELATPLLFANLLRWIAPEIFRRYEISGGSVGTVKLVMDQDTAADGREGDGGRRVGRCRSRCANARCNFFSGAPGGVKVVAGDREYLYSLTLPELWEAKWTPPADAHRGIPRFAQVLESSTDLWPWLALAGRRRAAGGMGAVRPLPARHDARAKTVTIRARDRGSAAMTHAGDRPRGRGSTSWTTARRRCPA